MQFGIKSFEAGFHFCDIFYLSLVLQFPKQITDCFDTQWKKSVNLGSYHRIRCLTIERQFYLKGK